MGTPNMRTLERQVEMDELRAAGLNPLEYMLQTLRDERLDPAVRLEAGRPRRTVLSSAAVSAG
jgi:hypothetical protein